MNLTRLIINEIIKQPQANGSTVFLSESLLPVNQNTARLAQSLNGAFSKDDNSYGNFDEQESNFFTEYNTYRSELTDASFVSFTQNVTTSLSTTLSSIYFAKGGFFVFLEYSVNSIDFVGVYLVRDVEGVLFNKDNVNHTFQISPVRYLDTNKLAMGGRINIQKWSERDNNHIALTRNKQTDISEYFINWIGITRPESNAHFTNKLFQIVTSIERPINPETGLQYGLNEFREEAYNVIKSSPNKIVNLRNLAISLFEDENRIIEFAESNGYELDHEFRYDPRALNKFKRISANRDGICLSFSRGDLNTKVSLSENENGLITIRSQSLATAIRQQMIVE